VTSKLCSTRVFLRLLISDLEKKCREKLPDIRICDFEKNVTSIVTQEVHQTTPRFSTKCQVYVYDLVLNDDDRPGKKKTEASRYRTIVSSVSFSFPSDKKTQNRQGKTQRIRCTKTDNVATVS
jgi:hypothetical protein